MMSGYTVRSLVAELVVVNEILKCDSHLKYMP